MAHLPPRSTREIEQLLRHFGLQRVRTRGPHDVWAPGTAGQHVPVPRARGPGQMQPNTVRAILAQAGISVADALAFWGITP